MYRIYAIKFNGEVIYVGQTFQPVDSRYFKHLHNALSESESSRIPKLYAHMRENKCKGYSFELLELVYNKKERNEREKYWILFYQTQDKCNTTAGGITAQGKDHHFYQDKKAMERVWKKSVKARKGKKLSEEHRKKQSIGQQKRADVRPLRCIQTGEIWESAYACARHFGVSDGAVRNRLDPNKKLRHNVTTKLKHYLFERLDKDDPGWQLPNHGQAAALT